jgi:hypothetical protein
VLFEWEAVLVKNVAISGIVWAVGVVSLLAGCAAVEEGTSEDTAHEASALSSPSTGAASTVRLQVRAGQANYVSVPTFADATCTLSPNGSAGAGKTLVLHADADQLVSFQFKPDAAATTTAFALRCENEASVISSYTVELQASASAPVLTPPTPKGRLRPALTGDLNARSDNELVAGGYPPRPDPGLAPREYKAWVADVSRPMIRASSKLARHGRHVPVAPGACPGGWCTANWAGYVVQNRAPYLATQGSWIVPPLADARSEKQEAALAWVGLGGFGEGGGGLWQAGTIQSSYWSDGGYVYDATIWYELITTTGGCCPMVVFTGTPVMPGDQFSSSVWFGDVDGYFGITGDDDSQYLWAYYANVTQGYSIVTSRQVRDYIDNVYQQPGCCVSGINGATAQWIVERPYVGAGNGFPTPYTYLADFDTVQMTDAETFDSPTWSFRPYGDQSPLAVGMYHCTTPDCSKLSLARPLATPSRGCENTTLSVRHRSVN